MAYAWGLQMKSQNRIEGAAFVGGLVLAAGIWASVHGLGDVHFKLGYWLGQGANKALYGENAGVHSDGHHASKRNDSGLVGCSSASLKKGTFEASSKNMSAGTSSIVTRGWTDAIEAVPRPYRAVLPIGGADVGQADSSSTATAAEQAGLSAESAASGKVGQPAAATGQAAPPAAAGQAHPPAAVSVIGQADMPASPATAAPEPEVRVYLADSQRVERVTLEQYVRGVVAAEMPSDFEPAALEAQALAARTYIVRRLLHRDRSGVPASQADQADITDTQTHQVYRAKAQMDKLRKDDEAAWRAVDDVVRRTQGLVIAYEGEPIEALYFSSSNGYTENSEDVFGFALPYLRSVDSPWDRDNAPRARETVALPIAQFYDKLGVHELAAAADRKGRPQVSVRTRTAGHRVGTLTVGDSTFTGVQVRNKLGLGSADFTWTIAKDTVSITTRGSGHGSA